MAHSLHVEAVHTAHDATKTAILDRAVPPPKPLGVEAQLIINGTRTVSLNREVFNIGRRPDNNLVLDDTAVSRHHLQIRLRHGRYILYDAESRGGTYVNGQLVKEHLLAPGDLIQIGQTSLLYLEEEATETLGDTQLDLMPPDPPT